MRVRPRMRHEMIHHTWLHLLQPALQPPGPDATSIATKPTDTHFNDAVADHAPTRDLHHSSRTADKAYLESKFNYNGFMRTRQADLQAYMRQLAAHPVLRASDIIRFAKMKIKMFLAVCCIGCLLSCERKLSKQAAAHAVLRASDIIRWVIGNPC